MSNSIGFNKLSSIVPTKKNANNEDIEKLDAVAESKGFESREVTKKISMRRTAEPKYNVTIRLPIDPYNKFATFVRENNYTQEQAFVALMEKAKI